MARTTRSLICCLARKMQLCQFGVTQTAARIRALSSCLAVAPLCFDAFDVRGGSRGSGHQGELAEAWQKLNAGWRSSAGESRFQLQPDELATADWPQCSCMARSL